MSQLLAEGRQLLASSKAAAPPMQAPQPTTSFSKLSALGRDSPLVREPGFGGDAETRSDCAASDAPSMQSVSSSASSAVMTGGGGGTPSGAAKHRPSGTALAFAAPAQQQQQQ